MRRRLKRILKHAAARCLNLTRAPEYAQVSYSQEGEDILISRILSSDIKTQGTYVDVGCNHPWNYSNTAYFYERGWRGVVIDPNPIFELKYQKERPGDIFINAGLSNEPDQLTYYEFPISFFNTFSKESADQLVHEGHQPIPAERKIMVKTLEAVLESVWPSGKSIDILSIDAEGFDYKIIQGHNFKKFPSNYIIIEDDGFTLENTHYNETQKLMQLNGYILISKLLKSLIYIHQSECKRLGLI